MTKYRKRPVVIEATQWFKNGDHPDDGQGTYSDGNGYHRCEGKVVRYYRHPQVDGQALCGHCSHKFHEHGWIDTLEGGHIVCIGDFIITGVKGERYPCKPHIFALTYEQVDDEGGKC